MEENSAVASVAQPVQRIPETQRREAEEQSVYAQIVDPRRQESFEIQRQREGEEQSVYAQIVDPRRQESLEIQRLRDEIERTRRRNLVFEECLRFSRRMQELGEPVPSMEFLMSGIPPPPAVSARVIPPRRTQEPIRVKTMGQPPICTPGEVRESRSLPKRRTSSPRPLPKRRTPSPPRPLPKRRTPSPPRLNRGKTRDYRSPKRFPPREAVQETIDRKILYAGPFTKWIGETPPNPEMELPKFSLYEAKTRAYDHICYFKIVMGLITDDEALFCKVFPTSLGSRALNWFMSLKPNSIDSWEAIENMFLDKYCIEGLLEE